MPVGVHFPGNGVCPPVMETVILALTAEQGHSSGLAFGLGLLRRRIHLRLPWTERHDARSSTIAVKAMGD